MIIATGKFMIGDVVSLKSGGGLKFTVAEISERGVLVHWSESGSTMFGSGGPSLRSSVLPEAVLELQSRVSLVLKEDGDIKLG